MAKKSIRLGRREAQSKELPFLCVCCGEPATIRRRKTFAWNPPWVFVAVIAGLAPFVIVYFVTIKRMDVRVPLCEEHEGYFGKRLLLTWGTFGGLVLFIFLLIVVVIAAKPSDDSAFGWICGGGSLVFLAWLVFAAILQKGTIRATEITDRNITLNNLNPKFVRGIWLARERRNEEEDEDRELARRRRRRRIDPDDEED